jgi:hypothetical protein
MPNSGARSVRARYFNAFRIASYLLVLYTLGHTFGAVIETPHFGAESDAVVAAMKAVHLRAQSADCTWYGFYRGFGLFGSAFFLFSVFVAWRLGDMSSQDVDTLLPIGWALFFSHVAGALITCVYFFPTPMFFSTSVAALLGFGCLRALKERRAT